MVTELMLGELYKRSHAVYSRYFTLVANQIVLFDALGPSCFCMYFGLLCLIYTLNGQRYNYTYVGIVDHASVPFIGILCTGKQNRILKAVCAE